jgi:hypothetical protein
VCARRLLCLCYAHCLVYALDNTTCPEYFQWAYDGCYQVTASKYNWFDGAAVCASEGSYLASFDSVAGQRWVFESFNAQGKTGSDVWIGLNDIASEGSYEWFDGSGIPEYTYWDSGAPNNYYYQHCVIMESGSNSAWNDVCCETEYYAMCKWNETFSGDSEGALRL